MTDTIDASYLLDRLGERLGNLLGANGPHVIPSAAPGGGPEADRESNRPRRGGPPGSYITRGRDALGFGGHGDALTVVDEPSDEVKALVAQRIAAAQRKGLHQPKPSGRLRLAKPISLEAHIDDFEAVSGPYSLFNGTIAAPGAGNSLVPVNIALPVNIPSPVTLLDRYPGALYMCLYVRAFCFVPTGTTMTGMQELWFSDITGSTCGLGIYVATSQTAGDYQNINSLLTGPITDPGNAQLGTLWVNNIGIGGTPVSSRYQLSIGYVAMVPDPWFNEQMATPPTPAMIYEALRTAGAQGN